MGPAATLHSCSGSRPACLGHRDPRPPCEGPLFGESDGTFHRLLFTSEEEAAHWPALGQALGDHLVGGPVGLLRVCVCVLSVRIYAKGAAQPVQLRVVEAQQPEPLTMQGTECGAVGQGWRPGCRVLILQIPASYLLLVGCDFSLLPLAAGAEISGASALPSPWPELIRS